jgi:RHS repeat-associated protein
LDGLYFYGSRWYDPYLNRWIQPDSIIPDPGNPTDLDRYAYARNNPTNYVDPSGHDPYWCGGNQSCYAYHYYQMGYKLCDSKCKDRARQDYLFSKIYIGSGKSGSWKTADWQFYNDNRDNVWSGRIQWSNPDPVSGWDLFALHVKRLTSLYDASETDQFMRDFALVFGGISAQGYWKQAAEDAIGGPTLPFINEGNQGLAQKYIDSLSETANQSHHYAGILFFSYFAGGGAGVIGNLARDTIDPRTRSLEVNLGDIRLGTEAAFHGTRIKGIVWGSTFYDIPSWIDSLSP